jgi:hypothetical protein
MTTTTNYKPNTYLARSESGMENGSVLRVTGRKKEKFAIYILGDFHGFTNELPEDYTFALPRKEARHVLLACFR